MMLNDIVGCAYVVRNLRNLAENLCPNVNWIYMNGYVIRIVIIMVDIGWSYNIAAS